MNEAAWRKLTGPIRRRIKLLVSRAVGRLVDPSTLLQTVQIELLNGELLDGVEYAEGYGRTAVPPEGWEGVAASVGGDRAHTILLAAFHRQYRVRNLAPGEQVIHDDLGNVIWIKRDRILVDAVDMVEVIAPTVHVTTTGDVVVNAGGAATVTAAGGVEIDGGSGSPAGAVNGQCMCAYTGAPHPQVSTNVKVST